MLTRHPVPVRSLKNALTTVKSAVGAMAIIVIGTVVVLSGCSSPIAPATDTSPSRGPAESTQPVSKRPDCSASAILAALPRGATMEKFECTRAGDTEWAAASVAPGPTSFFLTWKETTWQAEDSDSVCGSASAGLPNSLLSYCTSSTTPTKPTPTTQTPSPRPPTPSTDPCTSRALLAALPTGATMQRYTCAEVSGTRWAAARVSPGNTVFFLQWNGNRWNAQNSDSVCGTASAGLPPTLLSYCR